MIFLEDVNGIYNIEDTKEIYVGHNHYHNPETPFILVITSKKGSTLTLRYKTYQERTDTLTQIIEKSGWKVVPVRTTVCK